VSVRIFLACEDACHARVVQWLVDEIVVRDIGWLGEQDLDPEQPAGHWKSDERVAPLRIWAGRHSEEPFFKVHAWSEALKAIRIRLHGHIAGKPAGPDALLVRACLILAYQVAAADIAIVVRDVDNQPERRRALRSIEEAGLTPPLVVLLASPTPEVEAWIVAGFVPRSAAERSKFDDLCLALSFDPTREPSRMSSHGNPPERDAKAVHDHILSELEPDRWKACLNHLRRCHDEGADRERLSCCGVAQFFADCHAVLLPSIRVRLGSGPPPAVE
jgi:hypothetical protein